MPRSNNHAKIVKVSGPLVVADNMEGVKIYDLVKVGEPGLIGEVIELRGARAWIQVYEDTRGIGPGEPVVSTGSSLCVELGPGLIKSIYDGIQRPLDVIHRTEGIHITRGIELPGLARDKRWLFQPCLQVGEIVEPGDCLGEVKETKVITHKILVPVGIKGKIKEIKEGEFKVSDTICIVETERGEAKIQMLQKWPVREARPYQKKLMPCEPLATGQRVIDTFFPLGKGGTACVPGPFGSGKTVIQHQLAKWSNAQIIVYVGCGERGNEMTDVLQEFPKLKDPQTGEVLLERTVLIANTSNMPVAAREASVYTGITIAEYFRDMGYNVALMADSTSRWAEAMREISGRLEEMPGEEGYPAYLSTRIADFYERAGRVVCLGREAREGTLSLIGSVSPPGGDLADPVVQATLRVVKVFWSLEDRLAYERHFPAINWLTSYSLYQTEMDRYLCEKIASDWQTLREEAMRLLEQEAELQEIVRLVGVESISAREQLILLTARSIREDFLHQNAFHEVDTYTSFKKQYHLLKLILIFHRKALNLIEEGVALSSISALKVRERIARAKYIPEDTLSEFEKCEQEIEESLAKLKKELEAAEE